MSKSIDHYSLEELVEIQMGMDRRKYSERYNEISNQIAKKLNDLEPLDDHDLIEEKKPPTLKTLIASVIASAIISVVPLRALFTGVTGGKRGSLTITDEPVGYWIVTILWFLIAMIPILLLVKGYIQNRNEPD